MTGKANEWFTYLVWKFLPSCKDVTELISRSKEGGLSFPERATMRIHLYTCLACQRYLRQLDFISEACEMQNEKLEKGEIPAHLSPEASERLKKAIGSAKMMFFLLLFY